MKGSLRTLSPTTRIDTVAILGFTFNTYHMESELRHVIRRKASNRTFPTTTDFNDGTTDGRSFSLVTVIVGFCYGYNISVAIFIVHV